MATGGNPETRAALPPGGPGPGAVAQNCGLPVGAAARLLLREYQLVVRDVETLGGTPALSADQAARLEPDDLALAIMAARRYLVRLMDAIAGT